MTSDNGLRYETLEIPHERRQIITPLSIPAPSCLGGAHRRCLLDALTCCCPCHYDNGETIRAHDAAMTGRVTFDCAVCHEPFPTEFARGGHFARVHPVSTHPRDDVEAY